MTGESSRRSLLAAVAAGLGFGGCSSLTGGGGRSTGTLTPAPLPSASASPSSPGADRIPTTGDWTGRVDVVRLRGADRTVAVHPRPADDVRLAVGAGIVRPDTTDGPPVVRVVVRNRSEAPVSLPVASPLGNGDTLARRVRGGRLVLRSTAGARGAHRGVDGCWRSDTLPVPFGVPDGGGTDRETGTGAPPTATAAGDAGTTALAPDARLAADYWLLGPPSGPCLRTGLYRVPTGVDWTFTLGTWRPSAPGPSGASRHAGRAPPPLPVRGTPAWFHEATADTAVYLDPAAETVSAPATAGFVLRNHSRETLVGNPAAHELLKLVDGRWFGIAPDTVPTPPGRLPPGARQPWRLALSNGPPRAGTTGIPVGFLGGGTYAFRVGMARPGSPRVHAALLDLDAPRAPLLPTADLQVTDRRDGTVVATDARADPDAVTVLARRAPAPNAAAFLREQVMQSRGLRNTLGVLARRDATRVRLRTGPAVADRLLAGDRRRLRLVTPDGKVGYELRRVEE